MKTKAGRYFVLLIFAFMHTVSFSQVDSKDQEAVKQVLNSYKKAIETLDLTGVDKLFIEKSVVIESGKVEGRYQDYLVNHIGPELGDFKTFTFSDYKVELTVSLPYAFATETYRYSIVLKKDDSVIERKGVATSVLKKENGIWKIVNMHNSSRRP